MEILCNDGAYKTLLACILFLLIIQIYLGGTELHVMWKKSKSPYPGRLGNMLNALCCLLLIATQRVCKFSLTGLTG